MRIQSTAKRRIFGCVAVWLYPAMCVRRHSFLAMRHLVRDNEIGSHVPLQSNKGTRSEKETFMHNGGEWYGEGSLKFFELICMPSRFLEAARGPKVMSMKLNNREKQAMSYGRRVPLRSDQL